MGHLNNPLACSAAQRLHQPCTRAPTESDPPLPLFLPPLQAEFSLHTPEAAWRAGQGLRPYIKDAQQLLIRARETRSRRILQVVQGKARQGRANDAG